jgi:50S ribosomal subunit-associated GTPase HflX
VVILNKIDLCDDLDVRLAEATRVAGDVSVLAACALTGRGVKKLAALINPGDTVVFHRYFRRRQVISHQPALWRGHSGDLGSSGE